MSDTPEPRTNMLPMAVFVGAVAVLAVGVLAGLLLSSGSGDDSGATATVLDEMTVTIEISDFRYRPANVSVPAGATVTWVNRDEAPHDSEARDGSWGTDLLQRGEESAVTFTSPGTWEYFCTIHPYMTATITVR